MRIRSLILLLAASPFLLADDIPPALRSAFHESQHQLQRAGTGFRFDNPENRLQADFSSSGVVATHPEGSFGLRLAAYGYIEHLTAAKPASPQAAGARVEYRRGPLTEWYVNNASGLEQGFTLQVPPPNPEGGPLAIELAIGGNLTPVLSEGALQLRRADGAVVLHYAGLRAWDADGRDLPAHIELADGRLRLLVTDLGANYPVTIDPTLQQELTASDGAANDEFGGSVSISGDTAVIGAPDKTVGGNADQGAAYVFIRSGTSWSQQQQLTASDGATYDSFGESVSISGDTAVIGAFNKTVGVNSFQGEAYVFVRSGTVWSQQQKLTASDGTANDEFGYSVSIRGDTAVIGADNKTVGGNSFQGEAYVFVRSGTVWSQQQKLTASDGAAFDNFGVSVSMSISGDTAVIGADIKAVGPNSGQGAAYVFVRSGTVWSQQQKLTAGDGAANDYFGVSVLLSGDTAVIGAYGKAVFGNSFHGAAYVFVRSGTIWSQQQKLTASDGAAGDRFGVSVSISGDTAVIGASRKAVAGNSFQGAAYVFVRSGTIWSQQQKLTASDGTANDEFGYSVSVSGDTAVIGANQKTVGSNPGQGAVYVFTGLAPLQFVPVPPCRVMDTRNTVGPLGGPFLAANSTRAIPVQSGSCGIPNTAAAYALNITAVPRTGFLAYLTIWPTGQVQPNVPTLNSPDGSVLANAAVVPAGAGGSINAFATNDTDLVVDINGYFTLPGVTTLQFYPLTPCRVLDTRNANGPLGGPGLSNNSRSFTIPSSGCGAPATASAYAFNVTAVPHGWLGYLTAWPTGNPQPAVSTLNSLDGTVLANAAIIPAGISGAVSFYALGTTDLVVDITGYFGLPGIEPGGLNFYTLSPCRVVDTRNASGPLGGPSLAATASRTFPMLTGGCALPDTAAAYSLNMTAVPSGFLAYLTAWPTGLSQPLVSTLNDPKGMVLANAAIVPAGSNFGINVYVTNSSHLVIDTNGYFAQ